MSIVLLVDSRNRFGMPLNWFHVLFLFSCRSFFRRYVVHISQMKAQRHTFCVITFDTIHSWIMIRKQNSFIKFIFLVLWKTWSQSISLPALEFTHKWFNNMWIMNPFDLPLVLHGFSYVHCFRSRCFLQFQNPIHFLYTCVANYDRFAFRPLTLINL